MQRCFTEKKPELGYTRRISKRNSRSPSCCAPAFTFHLGDLPIERIRRMPSPGTEVGGSATCDAEAQRLAALGIDFIVAKGAEAAPREFPSLYPREAAPPDLGRPHERAGL